MPCGVWNKPGVPHRNWACSESEDLGEASHVCDMCDTTGIRYVHYLTHADYEGTLAVGGVCAAKMGVSTRQRERVLKNRQGRRLNWVDEPWAVSQSGNLKKKKDGMLFLIDPRTGRASVCVDGQWYTVGHYPTTQGAKEALFDRGWPPKVGKED